MRAAIKDFTEAIDRGVELADVYARRAEMQLELGNDKKVCQDLKKAMELDDNFESVYREYCK